MPGLEISAAICGATRDATKGAIVKRSINDENTILPETDNPKLPLKNALFSGNGK